MEEAGAPDEHEDEQDVGGGEEHALEEAEAQVHGQTEVLVVLVYLSFFFWGARI